MQMNTERGLNKTRIEALSDGVFAIAMTLLILVKSQSIPGTPWQRMKPETRPMMLSRDAQHSTRVALILTVNGTSVSCSQNLIEIQVPATL